MAVTARRVVILLLGLLPLAWLIWGVFNNALGADPAKAIVHSTGFWALRFMLITLAVTPLVRLGRQRWLMTHRRMLGLFALFYALCHLLAYYQFILGGQLEMLLQELIKRPYILVGAPALVILLLLGMTSTRGWQRRLGRNWKRLHQLSYLALILAWIHLFWQIRSSYFDAVLYGSLGLLVFLPRLVAQGRRIARRMQQRSRDSITGN